MKKTFHQILLKNINYNHSNLSIPVKNQLKMKYCFFTFPVLIAALCCILAPHTTTVVDAYLHGQRLSILRAPYIIYGYVEVMNGDQITGLIIDENRLLVHARFCQNK